MPALYDFSYPTFFDESCSLSHYRGKVLLLVNTASHCGFTRQYAQLEQLHRQYHAQGLEIIAFPCNQFGQQEPSSNDEILTFCQVNYSITFQLSTKIKVNGPDAHPLWQYLCQQSPGILGSRRIKWNFTKFLISRDGQHIRRYAPFTTPLQLKPIVEKWL